MDMNFCSLKNLLTTLDEKPKANKTGFQDLTDASNITFAYTRGDAKQIIVRDFTKVKKVVLKIPYTLVVFCYTPDGGQIVAIACPDKDNYSVSYKTMILYFFDVETGDVARKIEGKDSHTVVMAYDACASLTPRGLELVWATLMQINFWNLDTGEERVALKSVS